MTDQERAEKIVIIFRDAGLYAADIEKFRLYNADEINSITSQLDEAAREAVDKEMKERLENLRDAKAWDAGCVEGQTKGFQRGFAAAREQAAGILDKEDYRGPVPLPFLRELAERIRSMPND